ncbi:putative deoxynucleoside monophosphate kinase [Xanthomonas phage XaC1]|nr:putative deoxynucleoside monophosphate kinase [Xanthomonas phage XaC1]
MERKIIAINGTIGSGKDTFAKTFITNGFTRMSFAETLKDAVAAIFGWDREMLEGSTEESRKIRESVDEFWSAELGYEITPRYVLQHLGTDILREYFCDDLWILSLKRKLLQTKGNVIITDCRFPNEVEMLRKMNATIIEVQRVLPVWYEDAVWYNNFIEEKYEEIAKQNYYDDSEIQMKLECYMPASLHHIHKSEYSWVGMNHPDYIVQNTDGIEELQQKALDIITKI